MANSESNAAVEVKETTSCETVVAPREAEAEGKSTADQSRGESSEGFPFQSQSPASPLGPESPCSTEEVIEMLPCGDHHSVPMNVFDPTVFCRPTMNIGFKPPQHLLNPALRESIRPPKVVKSLETRLSELTEEQMQALVEIRKFRDDSQYNPEEVDDWMLLRYLVARDWKVSKSIKMLTATMEWRKDNQAKKCFRCVTDPNAHMMEFVGWDNFHRPVMYSSHRWSLDRANVAENVDHVLESYQHAEKLLPVGVDKWVVTVDFVTYSHWTDGRSKSGKEVINMLQDHFPERLGMQILIDPPTMFWLLWKILSAFVDEKTKQKVAFWYIDDEPRISEEFPKIFPPYLSKYLVDAFVYNKVEPIPKKKK